MLDKQARSYKRNCTVIALASVTGLPYEEAHSIAKEAGREDNRGFQSSKLIKHFNLKFGRKQFRKIKRSTITVQKFCKKYPEGHYFVRKRERILEAWKFIGNISRGTKNEATNQQ